MAGGPAVVGRGAANTRDTDKRAGTRECKKCMKTFASAGELQAHAALGVCDAGAAADTPPAPVIIVVDPLTLRPVARPTEAQSGPVRRRPTWHQQKLLRRPEVRAARERHRHTAAATTAAAVEAAAAAAGAED